MNHHSLLFTILIIVLPLVGCNNGIKKFQPTLNSKGQNYQPYFNKSIKPLKKEWKELYFYLKQGHILKLKGKSNYTYSYEFYKFLKKNLLRIYETPYLQDYNNFVTVFGESDNLWESDDRIKITYFQSVVGNSCETCQHDAFGYVFDAKTKKLLKE